jgi:glycosyltransferase involved in cell wall biosynthesis
LNEKAHIEQCINGVLAFENDDDFEVIIADGMSTDGTRDIIMRMSQPDPRIHMLDNPGKIQATGMNIAIMQAKGDIILRIDAHTQYPADYLKRCISLYRETGADCVGGPALTTASAYFQKANAAAYHSRFAVGGSSIHQENYEGYTDHVVYGCYQKCKLIEIGLYDEEMVRDEDAELNYRLVKSGGMIWQSPSIKSWYSPRDSASKLFMQYWQYGYWKIRLIQKCHLFSLRHPIPAIFTLLFLLSAILSPFTIYGRYAFYSLVLTYGLISIFASILTASKAEWSLLPVLPVVFGCYHFGYGMGFLAGLWDFVILRSHKGRFVRLTR